MLDGGAERAGVTAEVADDADDAREREDQADEQVRGQQALYGRHHTE